MSFSQPPIYNEFQLDGMFGLGRPNENETQNFIQVAYQ
jgi:hypothetical protein